MRSTWAMTRGPCSPQKAAMCIGSGALDMNVFEMNLTPLHGLHWILTTVISDQPSEDALDCSAERLTEYTQVIQPGALKARLRRSNKLTTAGARRVRRGTACIRSIQPPDCLQPHDDSGT